MLWKRTGFTLLEVLVSCTVLGLMLAVMFSIITQTSDVWRSSNARLEAFQGARRGFENLTQVLEQATLNTYWDYDDANKPTRYIRQSELHFLVGPSGENSFPGTRGTGQAIFFEAPANKTSKGTYDGLTGLLNASGFFVQYGSDAAWLPAHVDAGQARGRYRLMQWMEDTESLKVYETTDRSWIPTDVVGQSIAVADNVIALVIWPKEEGSPASPLLNAYSYDSRGDSRPAAINQLPPVLQVALVAIDETSAARLGAHLETTIAECLDGLFKNNPSETYFQDLKTLESRLTERSIVHRSFVSAVPLREAKWSP